MQNLEFNTGMIELAIQGDPNRVLRFNPTDAGFAEGFMKLIDASNRKLVEAAEKEKLVCQSGGNIEKIQQKNQVNMEADKFLRGEVDKLFGTGAADIIFEDICVTAVTENGEPVFMGFAMALLSFIESENKARGKSADEVIARYKPQRK